jgi:tetratricopeptide (TPR) repeat protein
MDRLLTESEAEFRYQEEKKRVKPRVYVPDMAINIPKESQSGIPPFLNEFIISKQQLQPVSVKLDSMIIKGSKILAKHPKSDYIEGTLYLMAVSYFYQNLWLNTQIKCGELIDKFPDGKLSPDAHLLMAKSLLIQRKFEAGKLILSRTVDIAWQLKRYDILSEAFRIQAELELFLEDYDEAVKPYKQAIIQSEDDYYRAKWQFDLAALVFRMGRFEVAEKLFAKVNSYSPDYLTRFESQLYQASSLARMGKFEEAEQILFKLENDGKYTEWISNVFAERMNIYRLKEMNEDFEKGEKYSDTAYVGSNAIAAMYFEKGMDFYHKQDYPNSRLYLGKCRSVPNPVSKNASALYKLLDEWSRKRASILPKMKKIEQNQPLTEKETDDLAFDLFEMGRVQERLRNIDSAEIYYNKATEFSPLNKIESARYIYVKARFYEEREPLKYDSLMELIIEKFPFSEYGQDAIKRLGYTENYIIDSVAELYSSGVRLWRSKEYNFAIDQFTKVFNYYPQSELAPKAIYSIAWIYEKDLGIPTKALEYYKLIIYHYPLSVYAGEVKRLVEYTQLVQNKEPIPDSLRDVPLTYYRARIQQYLKEDQETQKETTKKERPSSIEAKDLLSDPMKFFKDLKESVTDTDELLEEPKSLWDKLTNPDSLKSLVPGVKFDDPFKDLKKGEENKENSEENESDDDTKKKEVNPDEEIKEVPETEGKKEVPKTEGTPKETIPPPEPKKENK